MMKNIFWTISYSEHNKNRTVETKSFSRLKDAKTFVAENSFTGYILRHEIKSEYDPNKTEISLVGFFGSFNPSALEETKIVGLLRRKMTKEDFKKEIKP